MNRPSICAQSAWNGDLLECRRLYRQFATYFKGNFFAICSYYGWKRKPMLIALKKGRTA